MFPGRALRLAFGLALTMASVACGTGGATATPSPAAPGQTAPSNVPNLPAELADAVQQADGTYLLPDGRVFSAPDAFFIEDCGDARWPAADDTADRALEAGVPVDPVEWLTYHIHAYLAIFVDGEPEVVPAGIGIDNEGHRIAGLHTHDCFGTIHVEAEEEVELTLGQFAETWGIRLNEDCFDDLCGPGSPVVVQVNGEPVADPRGLVIGDCDDIAIVIGDPPEGIPPGRAEGC